MLSCPLPDSSPVSAATNLARGVIEKYSLNDLLPLLRALEAQERRCELNLAVFGRLKAGKSSFLNSLLGRPVLPVGVVPVTSVVTEIFWGEPASAKVYFSDATQARSIGLEEIEAYISEKQNPHNHKRATVVTVRVPEMSRYPRLRLVDTPGLESSLLHNTEATLAWTPNVDLALVAVGVDPPLTQQDVSLIRQLFRLTPNVAVLLTKVDILNASEQKEVLTHVESRLREAAAAPVRVLPYSVRSGYESLRETFAGEYLGTFLEDFRKQRDKVIRRKLLTLLRDAHDYLQIARKACEVCQNELESLREKVSGTPEQHEDAKLQLRLLARNASARTRPFIEGILNAAEPELRESVRGVLREVFPRWQGSFAKTIRQYEEWLGETLKERILQISDAKCQDFLEPLNEIRRQSRAQLQNYRDLISSRVERLFGISLRITESEIVANPPQVPDISIGRIFDHDWELLSVLIPMSLLRDLVLRRFLEKVDSEVHKNLSRLTAQWEEILRLAIHQTELEAVNRYDHIVATVQTLLSSQGPKRSEELDAVLARLDAGVRSLESTQEA